MKTREWKLDVIRIIASFFVVVIHVNAQKFVIDMPLSFSWHTRNLIACLVRGAVPFFFMLSGILFMEKQISIRNLYKKYIFRLAWLFVFWSVFYSTIDSICYLAAEKTFSVRHWIVQILSSHYHLWFLPCLVGVYIFLPVIQKLVFSSENSLLLYIGAVVFVTVIGKESLDPILKMFFNTAAWDNFWSDMAISGLSVGIIYFVIGYYLHKYYSKISLRMITGIYIINILLMVAVNVAGAFVVDSHVQITYGYSNLFVVLSSGALFVLYLKMSDIYHPEELTCQRIRMFSECTLGIYLIHPFLIEQIFSRIGFINLVQDRFPAFISVLMVSFLIYLLSLAIAWGVGKIPVVGKMLV